MRRVGVPGCEPVHRWRGHFQAGQPTCEAFFERPGAACVVAQQPVVVGGVAGGLHEWVRVRGHLGRGEVVVR